MRDRLWGIRGEQRIRRGCEYDDILRFLMPNLFFYSHESLREKVTNLTERTLQLFIQRPQPQRTYVAGPMVALRYSVILDLLCTDPTDVHITALRGGNLVRNFRGNIDIWPIRLRFSSIGIYCALDGACIGLVDVPARAIKSAPMIVRSTPATSPVPLLPSVLSW